MLWYGNPKIAAMKLMAFEATILHCKAILGRGQPGLMR